MRSIHDPRYQDLIKKLIELRESKHVTQVELARLLNNPQSYVDPRQYRGQPIPLNS
ncbi:helix-turn-helix transcriptional regulator [Acinetobacter haemolyticus]|nr:helix-turn-helix transcriptional regulator [Acinetobacter haemolyticus]